MILKINTDSVHFGTRQQAQDILDKIKNRSLQTPPEIVNDLDAYIARTQNLLQSIGTQGNGTLYHVLKPAMEQNQAVAQVQEQYPRAFLKMLEYFNEKVVQEEKTMTQECKLLLKHLSELTI